MVRLCALGIVLKPRDQKKSNSKNKTGLSLLVIKP